MDNAFPSTASFSSSSSFAGYDLGLSVEHDVDHVFWKASQSRCDALNRLILEAEQPRSKFISSTYSPAFTFDFSRSYTPTYASTQASNASSSTSRNSRPRPMRNRQPATSTASQNDSPSDSASQTCEPGDTSSLIDLIKLVSRKVDENSESKRRHLEHSRRRALMKQRELMEQRQRAREGKRLRRDGGSGEKLEKISRGDGASAVDVDTPVHSTWRPSLHSTDEGSPMNAVTDGIRDIKMIRSPDPAESSSQIGYSRPVTPHAQKHIASELSPALISINEAILPNSSQKNLNSHASLSLKAENTFLGVSADRRTDDVQSSVQSAGRIGGAFIRSDENVVVDNTTRRSNIKVQPSSTVDKPAEAIQQPSSSQAPKLKPGPPALGMRRTYNSIPHNNVAAAVNPAVSPQAPAAVPSTQRNRSFKVPFAKPLISEELQEMKSISVDSRIIDTVPGVSKVPSARIPNKSTSASSWSNNQLSIFQKSKDLVQLAEEQVEKDQDTSFNSIDFDMDIDPEELERVFREYD